MGKWWIAWIAFEYAPSHANSMTRWVVNEFPFGACGWRVLFAPVGVCFGHNEENCWCCQSINLWRISPTFSFLLLWPVLWGAPKTALGSIIKSVKFCIDISFKNTSMVLQNVVFQTSLSALGTCRIVLLGSTWTSSKEGSTCQTAGTIWVASLAVAYANRWVKCIPSIHCGSDIGDGEYRIQAADPTVERWHCLGDHFLSCRYSGFW